jgi:MFS family permease
MKDTPRAVTASAGMLVAARALQGAGGALLYPQVLSVIQVTFTGQARAKALGVFGSVIGIAVLSGQVVGGLLGPATGAAQAADAPRVLDSGSSRGTTAGAEWGPWSDA